MLANSAVPLLGLADTAVIGNVGSVSELAAIALGALILTFVYWSFGFLRMGTTGFTAQAVGGNDEAEVRAVLGRALMTATALGILLIVLQAPIGHLAFALLSGSDSVEDLTRQYFSIRIWGAPASLATFGVLGTFVGLGRSGMLLRTQLFLNGLNILLDVILAAGFGLGLRGIAVGTVIAEWLTLALALVLVRRVLVERQTDSEPFFPWPRVLDRRRLLDSLDVNFDILVRTLFLLFGFAWFTNQGARFGDQVLAANHILLQLVAISAYFLDGYAFACESLIGRAVGARRLELFDRTVRSTTELAAITAVALSLGLALGGKLLIGLLTDHDSVRELAIRYLPWTAIYVLVSFAAFQLDGIFIGATRTKDMRNASIVSTLVFLAACWPLVRWGENQGLWIAFVIYVVARALCLGWYFAALRADVEPSDPHVAPSA